MSERSLHPLAEDYLRRLRRAGRELPPQRLRELLDEIEGHLTESIPPDAPDHDALQALERFGSPGDIIEAERPSEAANRRGWREWATVVLLPLGGFAFGVGWLVGLVLLWTSRLWSTREKLIGTLVVPGGIATALLVLLLTGTKRRCQEFTTISKSAGSLLRTSVRCTPNGSPSAATSAWHTALVLLCIVGPVLTAFYLARRARHRSAFT